MNILNYGTRVIWLLCGILVVVVLVMTMSICLDIKATVKDAHYLSSQLTIEDIRHTLNIIEKELDAQLLELMIEKQRGESPLDATPENWRAFLDFCERTGYVVSNYNWHRYISGELNYR